METEVKLTKLATCAGCGAKVGAGTLVHMLEGFRTHQDPRLIVGYDKSDDASVYVLDDETALVQTTDFFPPIVDDPFLYGQIAAANAMSDVYAMGGEPKLALNILCIPERMEPGTVQEILRGLRQSLRGGGHHHRGPHHPRRGAHLWSGGLRLRPPPKGPKKLRRPPRRRSAPHQAAGHWYPHHRRQGRPGGAPGPEAHLPADGHPEQGRP